MARDSTHCLHLFWPTLDLVRQALWRPAVDVYQTRDGWLVKFDLAGVQPEDVTLSVQGSRLTLRGTRRDGCLTESCTHYSMERSYSYFERSLDLPELLDRARLVTEFRH